MKLFSLSVLLLASCGVTLAVENPAVSEAIVSATLNAKTAAKRGDAAAAEQTLLAANRAAPGTYDWQIESAQRLMAVAYELPREGSLATVPALITSALGHLAQAELLAPDARRKAAAKALTGLLYEQFRSDSAAALASYRAAAELAPEHPVAKQAADRLQRIQDNLRKRKVN